MQRLVAFDIAKAICIVLVVIGHYIPDNSPSWYIEMRNVIYSFHMPLFMFASGYIYNATRREEPYSKFIMKKIRRLMIPYVIVSFIVISLKLLSQGNAYVESPVTWMSYLEVFWSPSAGYFLWFIWALWWMFVFVPLFKTKRSRLYFLVLSIILHYVPLDIPNLFGLVEAKRMLVYFTMGVVWYALTISILYRLRGIS